MIAGVQECVCDCMSCPYTPMPVHMCGSGPYAKDVDASEGTARPGDAQRRSLVQATTVACTPDEGGRVSNDCFSGDDDLLISGARGGSRAHLAESIPTVF